MFCSKCGTETADDSKFCAECGQELKPDAAQQPPAPTPPPAAPQPVVVNAPQSGPYGTPGTGALWLSIFGFVCGIPALLGIIFGIAAYKEANRRGVSSAKATWAIVIGIAWFVPLIFVVATGTLGGILGASSDASSTSTSSTQTTASTPKPSPTKATKEEEPSELENLTADLIDMGFECTGPSGSLQLVQCTKGEVTVEPYGPTPVQTINIEYTSGSVSGFAKSKPLAKVAEYVPVEDFGDDGSGTGARMFG